MSQTWNAPMATSDTLTASRTVINDALEALRTVHSGSSAPASTVAYMFWVDTSATACLKQRNGANSAWITIVPDLTATGGGFLPLTGGTMTGSIAMGGSYKLTGLASGTASTDSINKSQADGRVLSAPVLIGTISASDNKYLMVTQATSTDITDVEIVSELAVTSDAGNYWTFQVRDLTGSLDLRSAVKSTNGAAITADTKYALGLDQNNTSLAAAKVLQLQMTKTGSPNNLQELVAVVKYKVSTP